MGGGFCHMSCVAGWANTSPLAGKSNQKLMAAFTAGTGKTMTEYAAFQIFIKVFFYVGRYRLTVFLCLCKPGIQIFLKHLIQHSFFRSSGLVYSRCGMVVSHSASVDNHTDLNYQTKMK